MQLKRETKTRQGVRSQSNERQNEKKVDPKGLENALVKRNFLCHWWSKTALMRILEQRSPDA